LATAATTRKASPLRHAAVVLCGLAFAVGLAACGETTSTSKFTGESHDVAQTLSDFQGNVTAREQKKLCENDLAASVTKRLQSVGGCQAVLKKQLVQLDSTNLTIESVSVSGATATAKVKSTYSGKSRVTTVSLVKEGSRWKIASTQQ
jgi:hypothetical protein